MYSVSEAKINTHKHEPVEGMLRWVITWVSYTSNITNMSGLKVRR